jgi:peptide/nickel transport system permease protein
MAALAVLVLIVVSCLLAPLYEGAVAHTDAFSSNASGSTVDRCRSWPPARPVWGWA